MQWVSISFTLYKRKVSAIMNENQKVVYNHFKSRASNDYEMSNTTMTANLRCLGRK